MRMYNERIYIFFNIEAGDWTWNCTRLCFVESIGFFWMELAAIVMNDFLTFHKLQWFKTSFLSLSWPTTAAVTTWLHLWSCLMFAPTAVDGMSVVALNYRFKFVAGWYMVNFFSKLSVPEVHTIVVFAISHRREMWIFKFKTLYLITFKTMAAANSVIKIIIKCKQ